MNEYTTNQPIGSTCSDHDITHRLHNGRCLDCSQVEITKEFPKGKENYCPRCYFDNEKVVLRNVCPHNLNEEAVNPTKKHSII